MLASTIFGSPLLSTTKGFSKNTAVRIGRNEGAMTMMNVVECSSRPQKKATAHHMKTRPKKTRPSEVRKKPAVYPPLPPLPSEWTLVEASASASQDVAAAAEASPAKE